MSDSEISPCGCSPSAPPVPPPFPARPVAPRRRRGCLTVFLLFLAIFALLALGGAVVVAVGMVVAGDSLMPRLDTSVKEKTMYSAPGIREKIAVVDIQGIIMGTDTPKGTSSGLIKSVLDQIRRDENVVAVILNLDTPGGEVIASDEIHNAVAALDVPVVACMRSVCASGGYYIAAAADHIVANEVTLTGSIGVIIPRYNYHDLLRKVGVEAASVKSGGMKDMLSGGVQRSPAEDMVIDSYIQSLVDETFRRFCTVVAEGRDRYLTWEDVKESEFGDGRVLLGRQAMEYGLVDECGYFEHAVAAARRLAGVDDANVVRFKREFTLAELLFAQSSAGVKIETGLESALPRLQGTNMYYLMPNLGE